MTKVSYIPYEVQDPTECLSVRERRNIFPYAEADDPFTVFQVIQQLMTICQFTLYFTSNDCYYVDLECGIEDGNKLVYSDAFLCPIQRKRIRPW